MEKVFDALETIGSATIEEDNSVRDVYYDEFDILKQALTELKVIKESNPSEELEALGRIIDTLLEENKNKIEVSKANGYDCELLEERRKDLESYKQALIKAQNKTDKDIAFDLINTKNVDIKLLKWAYPSVEAYNVKVREQKDYWRREELAKEEFDFLGRMVGAK